jgi:hypothetical protein
VKSETENAERSTSNSDFEFDVGRWMFSDIMKIVISPIGAAVTRQVRHQGD